MILLPRAAGTVNAPPLITEPAGKVVIERTWHMLHPIWLKRFEPATMSGLGAPLEPSSAPGPRGGAFVARINLAKALMSSSPSSPQFTLGLLAHGWLSGTGSNPEPNPTKRPREVFSVRLKRLVMPCSLRYASPAAMRSEPSAPL